MTRRPPTLGAVDRAADVMHRALSAEADIAQSEGNHPLASEMRADASRMKTLAAIVRMRRGRRS